MSRVRGNWPSASIDRAPADGEGPPNNSSEPPREGSPSPTDDEAALARIPPRFRVHRVLGRGGMGAVFAARDEVLGREVAIKCLPFRTGEDPQIIARFLREARAAAALRHPGIVMVHDVDPEGRFLVMERVEGESLARRLKRQRLSADEARSLGATLADTLGALHAVGIVHRDVKPANVLLEADGRPKLADFGIAALEGDPELTQSHQRLGTPAYTAPEQLRGLRVDGRADQFGLAATLFKALLGRGPFADSDAAGGSPTRTPLEALLAATGDAGLSAALARALSERPEDRFADASAMARALRAPSSDPLDLTEPGDPLDLTKPGESPASPTLEQPLALPVPAPPVARDEPPRSVQAGRPSRTRLLLAGCALAGLASVAAYRAIGVGAAPAAAGRPAAAGTEAPVSPLQATLARADAALERGDTISADAALAEASLMAPSDADVLYLQAVSSWWSGRPKAEVQARIRAADPGLPQGAVARRGFLEGVALTLEDQNLQAISHFRAELVRFPGNRDLTYGLFEALFHGGQPAEAVSVYRRLAEARPEFGLALVHLGDFYVSRGDVEGMDWLLKRVARLGTPWERTAWSARVLVARGEYQATSALLQKDAESRGAPLAGGMLDLSFATRVLDGHVDEALAQARVMEGAGNDLAEVRLGLALARGDAAEAEGARRAISARSALEPRARFEQAYALGIQRLWPADPTEAATALDALTKAAVEVPEVAARASVARLMLANAAGDPLVAAVLGGSPLPDVAAVARGFHAAARSDHAAAARAFTEAIEGASSHRVLLPLQFHRARVLTAAGRTAEVPAACELVVRPRHFEWTWGQLVGPCLLLTAEAWHERGQPERAREALTRLQGLRRAAPPDDALLTAARALGERLD